MLYDFAYKHLVKNQTRLTIELFSNHITNEEQLFQLLPVFNLNKQSYRITTVEQLIRTG